MQIDRPPGALSEWIGEWLEYLWSKRPMPPRKDRGGFYDGVWHDEPPARKPHNPIDNLKGRKRR